MQLLFKRSQSKNGLGRTIFKLWAKAACDQDEHEIARKYDLGNAVMIHVEQPGLLKDSIMLGLASFAVATGLLANFFWREIGFGWFGVGGLGAMLGAFVGFMAYHRMRETVLVADLMYGRTFKCGSVVELAQKEEWLRRLTGTLNTTMQASTAWDGEQVMEIPKMDGEDAIRLLQERI